MYRIIAIAMVVWLPACSAVFPNKTTDAREWQTAQCNGAAGWETCYSKAVSRCKNGFDIANQKENPIAGARSFEFACRK